MADQVWTTGDLGIYRFCTLCPRPAAYLGQGDKAFDVVWLCTDCADALADVVNKRRVEQWEEEYIEPNVPAGTVQVAINHTGRAVYKEAVDDGHTG